MFSIFIVFWKERFGVSPFTVWLMTVASALSCTNNFLRLPQTVSKNEMCIMNPDVFTLRVKVSTNRK